jgi:hypothetical protein
MSFLGTVLKGAVGFVTGGPAGAIAALGIPSLGGGMRSVSPMLPATMMPFSPPMPGGGGMLCPAGTACSGASTDGMCIGTCKPIMPGMPMTAPAMMAMIGSGRCPLPAPRGFHWNQKTYCTVKSGVVQKCTRVIKNRRLNPANGRAARRAVRRIAATHKLLKRIEKSIRKIKGVRQAKLPRVSRGRFLPGPGSKEVIVG